MRILLTLFLCLLLPCQSICSNETSQIDTMIVEGSSRVFEDYEAALDYVTSSGIPILMVLFSHSPSPVLDEVVRDGLDLGECFDESLKDIAAFAVIRPTGGNDDCIANFLQKFPEVTTNEQDEICLLTLLCDEEEVIVLSASPLSDFC